ncbi:MAG: hydroxymethylbilane synthase [Myxococcales bacterium]|nr:hydroxymethylbilane synthase [Myxococcales bacterium]
MTRLRIGTRGSLLALWQANHVKARLEALGAGLTVELVVIKTRGDLILDVPLALVGGKGLFVKELEEALLRDEADLAVHSMKDVPARLADGLTLAAISAREDASDALVFPLAQPAASASEDPLAPLAHGARVGTSSLRRMCQLLARRPDLDVIALRGNVDTRVRKLDAGEYDAIVLATAGLTRLGHAARIGVRLPLTLSLPAAGQGALGIETRAADAATRAKVVAAMHDEAGACAVRAERALLLRVEGGCQAPIAAHAQLVGGELTLEALVGSPDGLRVVRGIRRGPADAPESLGHALADELLARGAATILAECHAAIQPLSPPRA